MTPEPIGYFVGFNDKPAYDPGRGINCVVCNRPLSEPMKVHNFMAETGMRSYFFRVHADCDPSEFIDNAVDEVIGR